MQYKVFKIFNYISIIPSSRHQSKTFLQFTQSIPWRNVYNNLAENRLKESLPLYNVKGGSILSRERGWSKTPG